MQCKTRRSQFLAIVFHWLISSWKGNQEQKVNHEIASNELTQRYQYIDTILQQTIVDKFYNFPEKESAISHEFGVDSK